MCVTTMERNILRELAKRVVEVSHRQINADKYALWLKHNRLERTRPLIRVAPEGAWCELVSDDSLRCESDFGRKYERDLRQRIYRSEHLKDDTYISNAIWADSVFVNTGWGMEPKKIVTNTERGAFSYEHPLKNPDDFAKMKMPRIHIDEQQSQRNVEALQDVLGDILKVKLARTVWDLGVDTTLVDTLASLRGNEQFMMDMYERPEWIHEVMSFMTNAIIELLNDLEKNVDLEIVDDATCDGLGGYYITDELPSKGYDGKRACLRDLWGSSMAQEFVGVSPEMHYEFGLQYQIRLLEKFGLNCYGCCEPLDRKIDHVKRIPNLRRVSISPWADVDISASQLQNKYIFSWKPAPFSLAEPEFNTEIVRADITKAVNAARRHNCIFEMTLKDTHTVRNEPKRFEQWLQIAREVIEA